ncbi:MAG: TolC family protein, partial [Deltaproteobacteria bacterium]|nr:TolC family protein [Deltaproteobacteria bacterium]
QDIVVEIRKTVRNLRSAAQGITASKRRSEAAQEQLRAEQIRLKYGDSTPFDVLQKERDLVDAENQRIASYHLYRISLAALERAQGTILESHKIEIEGDSSVE